MLRFKTKFYLRLGYPSPRFLGKGFLLIKKSGASIYKDLLPPDLKINSPNTTTVGELISISYPSLISNFFFYYLPLIYQPLTADFTASIRSATSCTDFYTLRTVHSQGVSGCSISKGAFYTVSLLC